MNIILFNIPDAPELWPAWLEKKLVGPDLVELVAELKIVLGEEAGSTDSMESICGPKMPPIMREGLGVLSTKEIGGLFKQPELLLQLQERVLIEGGPYWDSIQLDDKEQKFLDESTTRIFASVQEKIGQSANVRLADKTVSTKSKPTSLSRTWQILAMAAAFLIVVGVWRMLPSKSSGWGFEQQGLLTANLSGSEYLNSIADAAGQWSKKRPATAADLEKRLVEFRAGCETLINAPHRQLSAVDRTWLVNNCRLWAAEIDRHISDVRQGQMKLENILGSADKTIQTLQEELRARRVS